MKDPKQITKVEGVDYTPDGIHALRADLIEMREQSFNYWPESITATVILTHSIALLAYLAELLREDDGGD